MLEPIKFLFILTGASTYLVTKYIKVGLDDPDQSNNSTNINDTFQFNNNNNHTLLNNNISSSSSSIDFNQNSFHYDDVRLGHRIHHLDTEHHPYQPYRNRSKYRIPKKNKNRIITTTTANNDDNNNSIDYDDGDDRYNHHHHHHHSYHRQSNHSISSLPETNPSISNSNSYYIKALITPSTTTISTIMANSDNNNDSNKQYNRKYWQRRKYLNKQRLRPANNNNVMMKKKQRRPTNNDKQQQQWPTFEIEINEEDDRSLPKRLLQITLTNDDNTNIIDHEHFIRYFLEPSEDDEDDDNDYDDDDNSNGDNNNDDGDNKNRRIKIDSTTKRLPLPNYIDNFSINHTNGEIFLLKSLDYDYPNGRPTYRLNAYAQNIQTKQMLSWAKIIIYLRNINDNKPFFMENIYKGNITENNWANISIIQVYAIDYDNYYDDDTDDDSDDNQLEYFIEKNHYNENGQQIFRIDSKSGWIITNVCCLDREQIANYTIIVSAIDPDGYKANATVQITVLDQNDCRPMFEKNEWHIELDENDDQFDSSIKNSTNLFQSKILLKLFINDNDLPESNSFTFKILQEKWSSKPIILQNEMNFNDQNDDQFTHSNISDYFIVKQIDKMTDDDNNNQRIERQKMNKKISLKNGQLTRNQTTGIYSTNTCALLLLTRTLDYENPRQRFIMLKILVTDNVDSVYDNNNDGSDINVINVNEKQRKQQQQQTYNHHEYNTNDILNDPKHSDICYIYIKIRDINDNKPKFLQNFLNITVVETLPLGSIVAKFIAYDPDRRHSMSSSSSSTTIDQHDDSDFEQQQQTVYYSLDEQTNWQKYFQIDSDTGIIRLNRQLDRETISLHIVKIIATDLDSDQPLSSTATLVINVDDINDNAPFIINQTLPTIQENVHPTRLGNIYAYDRDDYAKGNGPPFTFVIDPNASEIIRQKFRLESIQNGDNNDDGHAILYSRQTFDREQQKQYQIPIVVNDSGYPSLSSTTFITITIGDINDNDMKDGWKNVHVFYVDYNQQQQHRQQQQWRTKTNNNNNNNDDDDDDDGNVDESPPTTTKNQVKSLYRPIELGQINVEDPDDWDVGDKKFSWLEQPTSTIDSNLRNNFYIDSNRGQVLARKLSKGLFKLKFQIFDRRYQHMVQSTMNIMIKSLPFEAIINSGSLRIINLLDAMEFIRIWDWQKRRQIISHKERLELCLKQLFNCDWLAIISIKWNQKLSSLDIRYSARKNNQYLSSIYLNSMAKIASDHIRSQTNLNIIEFGINDCMMNEENRNHQCSQQSNGCMTDILIDWTDPYQLIDANFTSFIGINIITKIKCQCVFDQLLTYIVDHKFNCDIDQILCQPPSLYLSSSSSSTSASASCYQQERINLFTRSLMTSITNLNFRCLFINYYNQQQQQYERQQQNRDQIIQPSKTTTTTITNIRSFKSDGIIWLDPLPICTKSKNVFSVQISTTDPNGIIFYYGPIKSSSTSSFYGTGIEQQQQSDETDFMFLELVDGSPRLLFDFGSGIQEITINIENGHLNDGNWHQLDIQFDSNLVHLMLDACIHHVQHDQQQQRSSSSSSLNNDDQYRHYHTGSFSDIDRMTMEKCQNYSIITKFQHVLNVNSPLQLGGIELLTTTSIMASKIMSKNVNISTATSTTSSITDFNDDNVSIESILPPIIMSALSHQPLPSTLSSSTSSIRRKRIVGFNGCIKNVIFNNHIYDLINVHHSFNTQIGCHSSQSLCAFLNKKCQNNGYCDGSYNHVKCHCPRGFYGKHCEQIDRPVLFLQKSFLQLSLKLINYNDNLMTQSTFDMTEFYHTEYDKGFVTKIDFYFRTRQWQSRIIKLIGKNIQTYCLIEIREAHIVFRFNLNPTGIKSSEHRLSIDSFLINDGRWHYVRAIRMGQSAQLILDNGGVGKMARYSSLNNFNNEHNRRRLKYGGSLYDGYFLFDMNSEHIVIGGDVSHLTVDKTNIIDNFADGCISDLKINDIDISLGDFIQPFNTIDRPNTLSNNDNDGRRIINEQQQWPIDSSNHPSLSHSNINLMAVKNQQQHKTTMKHAKPNNNNNNDDQNKEMIIEISITKQQNIRNGCQSPPINSCIELHCRKPFICIDEWMVAKCRCPKGYIESNDGKNCIKNIITSQQQYCQQQQQQWQRQQQQLNLPCGMAINDGCNIISSIMNQENQHQMSKSYGQNDSSSSSSKNNNDILYNRLFSIDSFNDPHCSDHSAEQPPQPLEDNDDQQLEEHYLIDELSSSSSSTPDASNTNINRMNRKKNKQPSILNAQKFQLEYYGLFFIVLIILIPLNIPFLVYIGYICWRNRRRRRQQNIDNENNVDHDEQTANNNIILKSNSYDIITANNTIGDGQKSDDIRENIIYYHDEGGGECDIGVYDMYPLRIQIQSINAQTSSASTNIEQQQSLSHHHHHHLLHHKQHQLDPSIINSLSPTIINNNNNNKSSTTEPNSEVWQELTVI
ncbi:putative neural-cadherin 2 isoform X3 [Dermatophagoides pteronyssinus]|uniref:putative neural-cadherin 2 isoform X3 n=1 Tax=Dermatophagoides pteronyssinus TaxID=6956 RepID=UPI003F6788FF